MEDGINRSRRRSCIILSINNLDNKAAGGRRRLIIFKLLFYKIFVLFVNNSVLIVETYFLVFK